MALVDDAGEFHVFRNPRIIFEKMISTTQCTTVLLAIILFGTSNPIELYLLEQATMYMPMVAFCSACPTWLGNQHFIVFKYNSNEQTLSITVNITSTKADNASLFISSVRGNISEQRQEVQDDIFIAGSFVHETTNL